MKKKKAPTASPSTRGKNAARSQETSYGTQSIYRFQNESKYVSINSTGDFIAIPRKPGGIALPKVLKLAGMTVVFTGDLRGLKRDAAKVRVAQAGGTVANRVTRATNVLVSGKVSRHYRRGNRGKKIAQAIKLNLSGAGIHFISEQQFLHLASGKAIRK